MFKMACSYCKQWYWVGNGCPCWGNLADQALKNYREKEWVGLTDEEVGYIADDYSNVTSAVRAAEAQLKEKNT